MTRQRRLLLASLLAAWVGMFLACGGATKSPQEIAAEAKLEAAKKSEVEARTPEQVKAAKEAREKAEYEVKEAARAAAEAREKVEIDEEARQITIEKYYKIETGMTYEDVCGIVEVRGEELSRVDLGGDTTICVSWKNRNGSNMLLTFQGGRVVSKAQAGLPGTSLRVQKAREKAEAEDEARRAETARQKEEKRIPAREEEKRKAERLAEREKRQEAEEKQRQAEARKTAEKVRAEQRAGLYLKYAKTLIDRDDLNKAKERLQEIVIDFPDTEAAKEAKPLLEKLSK